MLTLTAESAQSQTLPSDEEARRYIENMRFDMMKMKLTQPDPNIAILWSSDTLELAIKFYKNYLWLIRKFGASYEYIPPSLEIDEVWHHHILDTRKYHEDCRNIFGGYLHHFPYFGMRGPEDKVLLNDSFEITQKLHFQEFGEYILSFDSEAAPTAA